MMLRAMLAATALLCFSVQVQGQPMNAVNGDLCTGSVCQPGDLGHVIDRPQGIGRRPDRYEPGPVGDLPAQVAPVELAGSGQA